MKDKSIEKAKYLVREFKGEIQENRKEIKENIKCEEYSEAAHLQAVNDVLDYVIDRLENEIINSNNT